MTAAAPFDTFTAPAARRGAPEAAARDPRLDVFRGLAMFIILLAHTPGNAWTLWIPARFGFSDATEIFVFCSGMASAIAFGRSFDRAGWGMGTARVGYRIWQIYWCHIAMFLAIATLLAAVDASGLRPGTVYIGTLNLWRFFKDPAPQLIGLMTLRYVPNYFDILPMYMAVLAMMPVAMLLARVSPALAMAASVAVWALAQEALLVRLGLGAWYLALPAEPWSDRPWFFNPFGWQLVFFTGFAFARGWLPAPPARAWLLGLAAAVVILSALLSNAGFRLFEMGAVQDAYVALTGCAESGFGACNPVFDWRAAHGAWFHKTDYGVLRHVHFLALAYLAWAAAGEGGRRLHATGRGAGLWNGLVGMVRKVGQQSLAVFVFSMVLARASGLVLDVVGRDAGTWAAVNLAGFALLVACAHVAAWFKAQPWRAAR
ncbi:OpgC family protein [Jannaschia sp. W003]|uniref:OpgC family protein n=1 Tax=Jannaschia sp. W003 TaxID=2867012 RepID=UPI0021A581C1|nr:OpgC domain-containing protein [Jannaschia sp. W003]UWQ20524.1 OpgC domain-containing protein [Jannaschia sp. W003]